MNRLIILILLLIALASCKKISNVHFHGHIINGCSGMPAANIQFGIYRYYDTGTMNAENIGTAITDIDGNYELIADVSTKGKFYYYFVQTLGLAGPFVSITHTENATADSKDVLMDGVAYKNEPFSFHIKNTNPFDNNDSFDYLAYHDLNFNGWGTIIRDSTFHSDSQYHNLKGEFVDFIYSRDFSNTQPDFYFKYTFTKNGITVDKYDTVHISCFSTTSVDIFY